MNYNPYNPFAELFETKVYPHARTKRTSLGRKIVDTFNVIAGREPFFSDKPHLGLFDYATLFIPAILVILVNWCGHQPKQNLFAGVIYIPLILINIPLILLRYTFAALGTLVSLPFIIAAHILSYSVDTEVFEEALAIQGIQHSSDGKVKGEKISLTQFLQNEEMDIEDLKITIKEASNEGKLKNSFIPKPPKTYQLMFWKKESGSSSASLQCNGCMNGECAENHAPFTVDVIPEKISLEESQVKNIYALFQLNIGGVVNKIEAKETDEAFTLGTLLK
ncbi:MAG: hypothetical protein H0U70_06230 [Tatlockia sp.]|nr:hypothetical protein [Tatlockia sp.]